MNAYEREPYRTELEVEVVDEGKDGNGRYVVLDDTILYPEGGGQPADHGRIGEVAIVDVQRVDGEIRHYLDSIIAGGPDDGGGRDPARDPDGERDRDPARGPDDEADGETTRTRGSGTILLRLDWKRRFDHMQQHTAQHLITAVAADELGWQTTSFHLGETVSDIELDADGISDRDLARLERLVAAHIRAGRTVSARRASPEDLERLDVRTRGLPEGHRGDVRLVEIDGVDRNTCGGTHLAATAEIESIVLLGTEPMRGGTRLHWIAGERVRRRLHRRERQAAAVRLAFETSDDELLQVAVSKLDRLKEAEREIKSLRASLAQQAAAGLLASPDPILDAHFERADAAFLQLVARELLSVGDDRPAFLTAEGPSGAFFAVCAAPGSGFDLGPVGGLIAEVLEGRGGGSAELIQGVAGSLGRRADARTILEEHLGGGAG